MSHADADLWTCLKCGEKFASKKLWHSCGNFSIDSLFQGCDPIVWETYRALAKLALEVAPFHIIPQKTRVCFQLRTRCAGGMPYKTYFRFTFISRNPIEHPRVVRVESYAPDQHGIHVKLSGPEEVDEQIRRWLELQHRIRRTAKSPNQVAESSRRRVSTGLIDGRPGFPRCCSDRLQPTPE